MAEKTSLTLYGDRANFLVKRPLIAAELASEKIEEIAESPHPSFTMTPYLFGPFGGLIGSNTCARFFARRTPSLGLYGTNDIEASQVDMFLDLTSNELDTPIVVLCNLKDIPQDQATIDRAHLDVCKFVAMLGKHLETNTYLVGERLTIADTCAAVALAHGIQNGDLGSEVMNSVTVGRWIKTVCGKKGVKKIVGELKAGGGTLAPVVKKTEEPKQPKKSVEDEAHHDEEDDEKPSPKKANALDLLPPSSLVGDAWKREYSNTKDLYGQAMTWFWKNFDAEGWSLWYMKYEKVEGECTVDYLTSNLLNGFLQRCDPSLRKFAFGVVDVVGEAGSFDYQGVWLFRGSEVPQMMKDHPSFEYHTFRRLSHETDRQLVADYWCGNEKVEGLVIADCKVYK